MGAFLDTTIGILVIIVFVHLMYERLKKKFPGMSSGMGEFFPFMKTAKPKPLEPKEVMKQTWSEHRTQI